MELGALSGVSEVISLARVREERQPRIAGNFICVGCRHEWTGVAPVGVRWHECPECTLPKGTIKHPFGPDEGDLALVCTDCGGEAMTVYKRDRRLYVLCMGCGCDLTHTFWEG